MLAVVVISFTLLCLPYRAGVVYNSFATKPYRDYWFRLFCRTAVYINSAINPILYNAMSVKFRRAFVMLLVCTRRSRGPCCGGGGGDGGGGTRRWSSDGGARGWLPWLRWYDPATAAAIASAAAATGARGFGGETEESRGSATTRLGGRQFGLHGRKGSDFIAGGGGGAVRFNRSVSIVPNWAPT